MAKLKRQHSTRSSEPIGPLPWRDAYERTREHPAVIEAGKRAIQALQALGITVTDPSDPRPMFRLGMTCSAQGDYLDMFRCVRGLLSKGTTIAELEGVGDPPRGFENETGTGAGRLLP